MGPAQFPRKLYDTMVPERPEVRLHLIRVARFGVGHVVFRIPASRKTIESISTRRSTFTGIAGRVLRRRMAGQEQHKQHEAGLSEHHHSLKA
jgi:hypothetical protein